MRTHQEEATAPLFTQLMSTSEAAASLGVARTTIARRVNAGLMRPAHRMPGVHGSYVFTAEEVARARKTPRTRKARQVAA